MRNFTLLYLLLFPTLSCLKISFNDDSSRSVRAEQKKNIVPFDIQLAGKAATVTAASDITFQEVDAGNIKSVLQLGKKTWIYLWGSWCTPCRKKLPQMAEIYRDNPDWNILLVSEDYNISLLQQLLFENRLYIQPYLLSSQRYGMKTHEKAQKLWEDLAPGGTPAEGFPQNYLFDEHGTLLLYQAGSIPAEQLKEYFVLRQ
ncbi:MAG: hypothetical protein IPH12_00740 [Saprospirales bacterium]|nr:hypothetical protein [Saprospirales bacterium]MBK8923864.1 hypothetical protein [Saprospirales bacterium]